MRTTSTWLTVALFWLGSGALIAAAEEAGDSLRLAHIFNDHMVLQRDKPLRIWGWAKPGAKVTVVLTASRDEAVKLAGEKALQREAPPAKPGEEEKAYRVRITYAEENAPKFVPVRAEATAGKDGRWQVTLQPLHASFQSKFLLAIAGEQAVAIEDVLVGEVWVCAGQSNMASTANRTSWLDNKGLLPTGVRYVHTGRNASPRPRADLPERATWKLCTEDNLHGVSTIPYLFGTYLHRKLQVPVGMIQAASGGAQGNYWCSLEELHKIDFWSVKEMMATHDKAVAEWEDPAQRARRLADYEKKYAAELAQWAKDAAAAKAAKKRPPRKPQHRPPSRPDSPYLAAYLYNGRILPIGSLAVRGVLYLQGEQQVLTWCVNRYEYVFPAVIRSFRTAFGDGKLPFGIITLQGGGHTRGSVGEVDMVARYAIIRDIHYRTHRKMPNTGYICAHDVGLGLHPAWKRPVAERTVHWALRDVYKTERSEHVSVDKIEYTGGRALVTIVKEQTRRKRGPNRTWIEEKVNVPVSFRPWSGNDTEPLGGFLIAGADKRWYPAKVKTQDKNEPLVVWSELVPKPVALRYGWGDYPTGNLGPWNDPLPPFRTDDWPLGDAFNVKPELQAKNRSDWYARVAKRYDQCLDRIIRQGRIDAAIAEIKLHAGAPEILRSKAERIQEVLDEINPEFYQGDRLRWVNDRDWKIRRQDDARLGRVKDLAERMKTATADKELTESVQDLRNALERYRKAVEKLQAKTGTNR